MLFSDGPWQRQTSIGQVLTLALVLLLAVLWGAVFLPALLRARQSASPIASVSMFRNSMRALGSGRSGRWVVMPAAPASSIDARRETMERRRKVFTYLLMAMATSLILGLIPGLRWMLILHLLTDVATAGFVGFLIHVKQSEGSPVQRIGEEQQDALEEMELPRASQF